MRTANDWPVPASNVAETACLVFTAGSGERTITSTTYYAAFEEATAAFVALYEEYPGIVWEGSAWEPDYTHRCSVPHRPWGDGKSGRWYNPEYGREVILFYKDDRRDGWQKPCRDKSGRFYRGAFLRETALHTVPGYGYMQRGKQKRDDLLPPGTARGDRVYANPDPVNIGGAIVDQQELNRVHDETGRSPTHLAVWDPSGSYLYLKEIVWGDEGRIIVSEVAAALGVFGRQMT